MPVGQQEDKVSVVGAVIPWFLPLERSDKNGREMLAGVGHYSRLTSPGFVVHLRDIAQCGWNLYIL